MGDFPELDFAAEGERVAAGVVDGVGGSLAFFSVVDGTAGVADVNALDCAHEGSANK